jgi:hypothetical protein
MAMVVLVMSGTVVRAEYVDGVFQSEPGLVEIDANVPVAVTSPGATVIDFDDVSAPCTFVDTVRLTELYASLGVHFLGPGGKDGGAIVNKCGNFGVSPVSGDNFLAFNRTSNLSDGGTPKDPETIVFDSLMAEVSIYAAGGNGSGGKFTMMAYDVDDVLVDSAMVITKPWALMSVSWPLGIKKVVLEEAGLDNAFVYDNLSFEPVSCVPPGEPNNPDPPDGATNVLINACLSWNGGTALGLAGADPMESGPAAPTYSDQDLDAAGNLKSSAASAAQSPVQLDSMGSVINSFPTPGSRPGGLTWKDGYLYHADYETNLVYKLDPADGTVLSTIGPFPSIYGVAWDGTHFWGTDGAADEIFEFDISGTVLKTFPAPSTVPVGVVWDGSSLWVCDSEADRIYEINPSDGSVLFSFAAPDTRVAGMAFDGTALWTNGRDSARTYRVSRDNGAVLASFPTPPAAGVNNGQGAAFDGQYLWVANWDRRMIYQVDIEFAPPCPTTWDVYFGTDAAPLELIAADLTEPTCCPGELEYDTTYYWKVVAKNCCGQTEGPVWSFTTEPVPNQAPNCVDAVASIPQLWPPNHKWVEVEILGVTDPDGNSVTITITGITQDEPVAGEGSGKTCPDGDGVGTSVARLRAERAGLGNGRVYEISFEATDELGGACVDSVQVCVPHDRGRGRICVDDGQLYDSTASDLLKADLNDDGTVDETDLAILTAHWLRSYQLDY